VTTASNRALNDRRILALGLLALAGLFLFSYGVGGSYPAIGTLGGAVALLGPGFIVLTSLRGKVHEVIRGNAYVHSVSPEQPPGGAVGRCEMHLRVDSQGVHGATVRIRDRSVPADRWPYAGQTVPVLVPDRRPRRAQVLWEHVPVRDDSYDTYLSSAYVDSEFDGSRLVGTDFSDAEFDDTAFTDAELAELQLAEAELAETDPAEAELAETDPAEANPAEADPQAAAHAAATSGYEVPGYPADATEAGDAPAATPTPATPPAQRRRRPSPRPVQPAPQEVAPDTVVARAPLPGTQDSPAGTSATRTPRIVELMVSPVPRVPEQAQPADIEQGAPGVSVTLVVSDLERSLTFYRDTVGLTETDSGTDHALLVHGAARLLLRQVSDASPVVRRVTFVNLEVDDVHAEYERLRSAGVEFSHRPRVVNTGERLDQWAATFRDPDGHAISLTRWANRP